MPRQHTPTEQYEDLTYQHMIDYHEDKVAKEMERGDNTEIVYEIDKAVRQGVGMTEDWNKIIRDKIIIAAEYALEKHENDHDHEPDEEEGER